ncbi:unnamed protein product [Prorocentrum cordatum]|uniref:Ion transport domain-containing protein n=1 Tax=Prorocentrum cordatum TaxID=2364126 RepID=A0ABN9QPV2_9DINO|nr:unnamed protein product [Polarella glacialis]
MNAIWKSELPAMQPDLFRQRLLELAAEYESLYSNSADCPSPVSPPRATLSKPGRLRTPGDASPAAGPTMSQQLSFGSAPGSPVRETRSMPDCTSPVSSPSRATPGRGGRRWPPSDSVPAAGAPSRQMSADSVAAVSSRGDGESTPRPAGRGLPAPRRSLRSLVSLLPSARPARPRLAALQGSPDGIPTAASSPDRAARSEPCPSLKEQRRFNAAVRQSRGAMRISLPEPEDGFIAQLVKGRGFSIGIACLIIFSTVLIGIETQVLSSLSSHGSSSDQWMSALSATNYALTVLFTVEMVARLYVFRLDFFVYERVHGGGFDVIILLLALVEVVLAFSVYALSGTTDELFDSGGSAKVLRLFRLTRLLRLVRTFRQLKPLRLLLHSLYCAGKSVFWALLLLFIIVYSFGVILTQAVTVHTEGGTRVDDPNLTQYYGTLSRSMLSLWWAVSGGISWNELTEPLVGTGSSLWRVSADSWSTLPSCTFLY